MRRKCERILRTVLYYKKTKKIITCLCNAISDQIYVFIICDAAGGICQININEVIWSQGHSESS